MAEKQSVSTCVKNRYHSHEKEWCNEVITVISLSHLCKENWLKNTLSNLHLCLNTDTYSCCDIQYSNHIKIQHALKIFEIKTRSWKDVGNKGDMIMVTNGNKQRCDYSGSGPEGHIQFFMMTKIQLYANEWQIYRENYSGGFQIQHLSSLPSFQCKQSW